MHRSRKSHIEWIQKTLSPGHRCIRLIQSSAKTRLLNTSTNHWEWWCAVASSHVSSSLPWLMWVRPQRTLARSALIVGARETLTTRQINWQFSFSVEMQFQCGSDGRSYMNQCLFECAQEKCSDRTRGVTIARRGHCDELWRQGKWLC